MNDMTNEQEKAYEAWWNAPAAQPNSRKAVFCAGWKAGRAEILGRAYEAFREGRDETAQLYRELATEIFGKQS